MSIRPIDANALLKQIDLLPFGAMEFCELARVNHIVRIIQSQPTLDYAPVRNGEWEWDTLDIYMCSACGEKSHVKEVLGKPAWDFCPNCGSKMKEE